MALLNGLGPDTGMIDGQVVAMPANLAAGAGGQVAQPVTSQGAGAQTLPPAAASGNGAATAAASESSPKAVVLWSLALFLLGYFILHAIHYAP